MAFLPGFAQMVYPEADHGFMHDGGERYDPESAPDAWNRLLDFFSQHLD